MKSVEPYFGFHLNSIKSYRTRFKHTVSTGALTRKVSLRMFAAGKHHLSNRCYKSHAANVSDSMWLLGHFSDRTWKTRVDVKMQWEDARSARSFAVDRDLLALVRLVPISPT